MVCQQLHSKAVIKNRCSRPGDDRNMKLWYGSSIINNSTSRKVRDHYPPKKWNPVGRLHAIMSEGRSTYLSTFLTSTSNNMTMMLFTALWKSEKYFRTQYPFLLRWAINKWEHLSRNNKNPKYVNIPILAENQWVKTLGPFPHQVTRYFIVWTLIDFCEHWLCYIKTIFPYLSHAGSAFPSHGLVANFSNYGTIHWSKKIMSQDG